MKRWFGIFFILILSLEAGTTASNELGQGYTYWSSFKPGTMVAFRYQSTAIGKNFIQIRFRLNSVDPDRAVIIQDLDTSSEPNALVKGIKTSLEFKAEEFARKKEDLFHGGLQINLDPAIWGTEDEVQRSAEELIVQGTRIPTDRLRISIEKPGVRNTLTVWTSPKIPGNVVKAVRDIQAGSDSLHEEIEAVEFSAFPASPDEIARLRAARKPVAADVNARDLFFYEARFMDDMADLQKLLLRSQKLMSSLHPDSSDQDWNEFNKFIFIYQESIGTIKSHWDEDLRTIEGRLNDSERMKIKSLIEAISLCVTSLEKPFKFAGRITFLDIRDPVQALAFVDECKTIQLESLAAWEKLREEYPKLRNMKLKYQR